MSKITNSKKIKMLACFSCAFILMLVSSCKKKDPVVSSSSSSNSVEVSTSSSSSSSSSIVSSSDLSSKPDTTDTSISSSEETSNVSSSENASTSESSSVESSNIESSSSESSSIEASSSESSSSIDSSSEVSSSEPNSSISSDSSSSSEDIKLDFDSSVKMDDKIVTYDGNEHSIVVVNAPEGATITYKDGKNSYVNAGTYSIIATIEKEGYNTKTLTATLTIEKIDINVDDIVINNVKTQYDSSNKNVTVEGLPAGVTTSIKYYTDEAHTTLASNTKDVGKYHAVISFNVGQNYNPIDDMYGTVEITKKTYDISNISIDDIVYDATVLTKEDIVITNLPKSLSVSEVKFYATNTSEDEIDVIDVGTYYASIKFANNNSTYYEDVQPSERMEFNVVKKVINVNWSDLLVTYNGKAQTPKFELDTPIIDGDETNVKLVGEAKIKIGTYDVSVQLEGKDASNYELKNASTKFVITSPVSIVKVESKENLTEGYYVFTYGNLAFLPEKVDGTDKGRVAGVSFDGELSYDTFEQNRLWYIEKDGDNYYIKAPNGKYLVPNSKGFNLSETKTAWTASSQVLAFVSGGKTIRYNNDTDKFGYYSTSSCEAVNYYRVSNSDSYDITVNELDPLLGTAQVVSSTGSFEDLYCFDKITITGTVKEGKTVDSIKVGDTEYEFEIDPVTRVFRCEFVPSVSGTLVIDVKETAKERDVEVIQVDNLTITAESKYLDRQDVTITVAPNNDDYYVKEVIVKDSDGNIIATTKNGNNYSFVMANGKNISITAVAGRKYLVNVTSNDKCDIVLMDKDGKTYENNTKIQDNVKLFVNFEYVRPYFTATKVEINGVELVKENDEYSFEVKENVIVNASVSLMNETKIVDIPSSSSNNGQYYLSSGIIDTLASNDSSSYLLDFEDNSSKLQLYKFGNKSEYNAMKAAGISKNDYLMVYGEYELFNNKRELKSVVIADYVGAIKNLTLNGDKITWSCNYAKSYDVYNGETLVAKGITAKEFALTDAMKEMDVSVNFKVVAHGLNDYLTSSAELKVTYLQSYSITYVYNDGIRNNQTLDKLISIPETLEELNREGYLFLGWFTDEACTSSVISGTKLTGNITLYAGWKQAYNVTYAYNDGISEDKTLEKQAILPKELEQPERDGYLFLGWYREETFENKVVGGTELVSDITLYANWTKAYYVKVTGAENATIEGLNTNGYPAGEIIDFTITPKEGYRISKIESKEGEEISFDEKNTVLLEIPSNDVELIVSFVRTYKVSYVANDNADIYSGYKSNPVILDENTKDVQICIYAKYGYTIDKVLVNDVEVTLTDDIYYTIETIDKDYEIKVITSKSQSE